MTDETKATEVETDEKKQEESITGASAPSVLDEQIINPMTGLIRSMRQNDEEIRTVMGALKRLWKQTKGRGQATLSEIITLFAGLYQLNKLGSNQNMIFTNQCTADLDRQRLHLRAIQEFLIEAVVEARGVELEPKDASVPEVEERRTTAVEEAKQKCRDRIDELFRIEKGKMQKRREEALEAHKDKILGAAVDSLKRPPLKKEESKAEEKKSNIITLP